MNWRSFVAAMRDDPTFFVLGVLSVLVVLTYLQRGGWKYITGTVLGAVNLALALYTTATAVLAVVEFIAACTAPPARRGDHLMWGFILLAATLLSAAYYDAINETTPVGRFLRKLKP